MRTARRWSLSAAALGLTVLAAVAPASAQDAPPSPTISDGGPSGASPGAEALGAAEPAGAVTVINTSDKAAVTQAYLNRLIPAERINPKWTGSVGGCKAGSESLKSKQATVAALNYFRSMAGLGPVTRNESYEDEALRAALMMDAANQLSHFSNPRDGSFLPNFLWPCASLAGMQAAYSSNIAYGVSGAATIEGYMDEPGASNAAAGHRRWFLYAPLRKVGVGSTADANTVRVLERPGAGGLWGTPLRRPAWVSWPNKGYVPWELLPTDRSTLPPYGEIKTKLHRWSLASPKFSKADFSGASVSMTMNGARLAVTEEPYNPHYADNTLVWTARRRDGSPFPMSRAVTIRVVVSGIKGGPSNRYAYTVRPYPLGPPSRPDAKQPDLEGRTFIAKWGAARPTGTPVTGYVVQLWNNGKPDRTKRVGPAARSASFTNLTPGRKYCYYVAANSKAGMGEYGYPHLNCWTV